jgi:hypothetical protein
MRGAMLLSRKHWYIISSIYFALCNKLFLIIKKNYLEGTVYKLEGTSYILEGTVYKSKYG